MTLIGALYETNVVIFMKSASSSEFLSSSTEIDTEEKDPIRRSKRLIETNPIIRYENPIYHDYRKHHKKTEFGNHTESTNCSTGREKNDL